MTRVDLLQAYFVGWDPKPLSLSLSTVANLTCGTRTLRCGSFLRRLRLDVNSAHLPSRPKEAGRLRPSHRSLSCPDSPRRCDPREVLWFSPPPQAPLLSSSPFPASSVRRCNLNNDVSTQGETLTGKLARRRMICVLCPHLTP